MPSTRKTQPKAATSASPAPDTRKGGKGYVTGRPGRRKGMVPKRTPALKNERAAGRRTTAAAPRSRRAGNRMVGEVEPLLGTPRIRGAPQRGPYSTRTATSSGHRSANETPKGKQHNKRTPKGRKAAVRTLSLPVPRPEPTRRPPGAQPPRETKTGGARSQRPAKGKGEETRRVTTRRR